MFLLALVHPVSPRQRAIKQFCVCVRVRVHVRVRVCVHLACFLSVMICKSETLISHHCLIFSKLNTFFISIANQTGNMLCCVCNLVNFSE